jgi:protein-tyrosine kinase
MERIKKALEQAERDREVGSGLEKVESSTAAFEAVDPVTPQRQSSRENHSSSDHDADDFRGQRSRIVDVSVETREENRLVAALPDHELTDAYRILRTRVLQAMNANRWNALAITSPATGCGKSLTSINLAISLAREVNRTVLLADFDLRNPSIHKSFGYEPELGLSDYLFGEVALEDILFSPSVERLVVLPGRESIHNSSEMLRSPKTVALVEELKQRYDDRLIIFDLPPILAVDDALAFAPYVDAMLMVAENGTTQKEDLEKALDILQGTPLIGTVLNKSDTPFTGYKTT